MSLMQMLKIFYLLLPSLFKELILCYQSFFVLIKL